MLETDETTVAPAKVLIVENFRVWLTQGKNADGTDKPDKRKDLTKGQVLEVPADIPEGQSAEDWITKGLAKAA